MLFRRIKVADFDFNEKCRKIAEQTEGLSGREIAKLGVAWQVTNYKLFPICLVVFLFDRKCRLKIAFMINVSYSMFAGQYVRI